MKGSPLTPAAIGIALRPIVLLPGAPQLTEQLARTLLALFETERITCEELAQAVVDTLRLKEFWPAPAFLIERVQRNREEAFLARRERERRAKLEASRRPEVAGSAHTHIGPVTLPDGSPDPDWPEIEGREPAWRRKLLCDLGVWSRATATARTTSAARGAGRASE